MRKIGTIKTVTFYNADNGYSVLKLSTENPDEIFTAVGFFPHLNEGEILDLDGDWSVHSTYGRQFKTSAFKILPPVNTAAIESFLCGGLFKGVGPVQAKLIVDTFGDKTFDILDNHPEQLAKVKGIGKKKRENLLIQWEQKLAVRDAISFFQSYNLSLNISNKIIKYYGPDAVKIIKENPYRLAEDMWGVGFIKADEIAKKLGLDHESYKRVKAGLTYTLSRSSEEGHIFLTKEELMSRAGEILQCQPELIIYSLDNLSSDDQIYADSGRRYYRSYLYHCETGIARQMIRLSSSKKFIIPNDTIELGIRSAEEAFSSESGRQFRYLEEQKQGIEDAIRSRVFILTGGPGTGKTTTLRGILHVFNRNRLEIRLAAPTGRAARRMSEITGIKSQTIHRLLQYEPATGNFHFNSGNPLDADAVVIDEVSMIDTVLMYSLLKALSADSRLILIGDSDQLPSVGPGKILSELITSGVIPNLHLRKIVRQEETSQIILNAHKINRGIMPDLHGSEKQFFFRACPSIGFALEKTVDMVCRRLPEQFGYNPFTDIHVLTPMNKGPLGTQVLNTALQEHLNRASESVKFKDQVFKPGDKVMQLKNNYEKNVFNGDIGLITSLDIRNRSLEVCFEEKISYTAEELDQLRLAYATTVHKSQGSEYKAVVIILSNIHFIMLQRNLLYTAITRAKERVFMLSTISALRKAVENNPAVKRNTLLAARLRGEIRE